MQRSLLILAALACALAAQAQGTLQFRATLSGADEVPPTSDPTVGIATLTLTGNVLDFYVYVPALTFITTGGSINGPAPAGSTAPILFDLGAFRYHSGSTFGDPPFYSAVSGGGVPGGTGPFMLTASQMDELINGLWYVNITSYAYPDGQLRGQILPVPEPSALALLGIGVVLLLALCLVAGNRRVPIWGQIPK